MTGTRIGCTAWQGLAGNPFATGDSSLDKTRHGSGR